MTTYNWNSAAHIFMISKKTGRMPFALLQESGVPSYPAEEVVKIAATMTPDQVAQIVQRLSKSVIFYNANAAAASRKPWLAKTSEQDYYDMAGGIGRRMHIWKKAARPVRKPLCRRYIYRGKLV